ncbi:MAG: TIGR02147 family protein [Proteobacteria bacterium]|nr:TIGR02147 family protein [Pseudomonadota bacterium]
MNTITSQEPLREALLTEWSRIRQINPAFSLRSFAKRIGLQAPALSQIINGKRRVSLKLARRLLDRLDAPPLETQRVFKRLVDQASKNSTYQTIDMDHYHLLADWFHFSILSLVETNDFNADPVWIADRLKISKTSARTALTRLKKLGFLAESTSGKLSLCQPKFATSDNVSNLAVKKSHSQSLDLAKLSLYEDDLALRDITTMNLAIDIRKIPQAKIAIREFREKIANLLETNDRTEVYQLCVQLFPVSKTQALQ